MMKSIAILIVYLLLGNVPNSGLAQTKKLIEIGEPDSLFSNVLQESREIYLHFPESYHSEKKQKYPVVYVLDGDVQLNAAALVYDNYWGGFMPEMIIVGISNSKNRTRDLTTSKVETRHGFAFNEKNGEADRFTKFLTQELIPYVDEKYNTSNYRTLIGHSYGGLFTIHMLINHPDYFANYLAIDPSLDWDEQKLLKQAKQVLMEKDFSGKSVFVSLSGQLHMQNSAITIDNVMQDSSEFTLFPRSNIKFSRFVENHPESGLNLSWKFYPNDLHGTVVLPSIMDGLLNLFEWYQMENTDKINNPETPIDELETIIRYREQKLKTHFNYFVPPYPEDLLTMSGYMNMDMGQPKKARWYFELCVEYFPGSSNVYDSFGDYYIAQGDTINALKMVRKAFELSGSVYHKKRVVEYGGRY